MEIKNFTITKRDGGKDRFSMDKIMNAIIKAFDSVNEPIDLGNVSKLISRLNIYNNIKVEDIQNQVEEALMAEGFFKVAKSFMLYRQQHTEDRETLERLKFLTEICRLPMPLQVPSMMPMPMWSTRISLHLSANCPSQVLSDLIVNFLPTASKRCTERNCRTNI